MRRHCAALVDETPTAAATTRPMRARRDSKREKAQGCPYEKVARRAAALALVFGGRWWSRPPPPAPVVTPSMLAARPPAPVVPVRPPAPEPRPGRRLQASVRCAFVSPAAAGRRDAVRRVSGVRPPRAGRVPLERRYRTSSSTRAIPEGTRGPAGARPGSSSALRASGHRRPAARGAGAARTERGYKHSASTASSSGTRWRTSTSSCASTTTSSSRHGRPTTHSGCSGRATRTTPGAPRRASRTARRPGPSARGSGPCEVLGGRGDAGRFGASGRLRLQPPRDRRRLWRGADVRRYLAAVDATGHLRRQRRAIQSAAVRLFARGHVVLPGVEYAHVSRTTSSCGTKSGARRVGAAAYPAGRRTTASRPAPSPPRTRPPSPTTPWRPACPRPTTRSRPGPPPPSSRRSAAVRRRRPWSARPRLPHCCCRLDTRRDSRDRALVPISLSRQLRAGRGGLWLFPLPSLTPTANPRSRACASSGTSPCASRVRRPGLGRPRARRPPSSLSLPPRRRRRGAVTSFGPAPRDPSSVGPARPRAKNPGTSVIKTTSRCTSCEER